MKALSAVVVAVLTMSSGAYAEVDQESDLGQLDTSVEGIDLTADLSNPDFQTMFEKQDKDFPDQVAAMIAAEKEAWQEQSEKIEKSLYGHGIEYQRAYRSGFRSSFYNGYRYANCYSHGYSYQSYYSPRVAYSYSYWSSARSYAYYNYGSTNSCNRINSGYGHGYSYAYSYGYHHGRHY